MTVYNAIMHLTQRQIWQNKLESFMKWRHHIILSHFWLLITRYQLLLRWNIADCVEYGWPGQSIRYSNSVRDRVFRVRVPFKVSFYLPILLVLMPIQLTLLQWVSCLFNCGQSARGVPLTTLPLLVYGLKKEQSYICTPSLCLIECY